MGFATMLSKLIIVFALQSFKEHEGLFFSFEKNAPPWGFCPPSLT
jgi:hypothetical protein